MVAGVVEGEVEVVKGAGKGAGKGAAAGDGEGDAGDGISHIAPPVGRAINRLTRVRGVWTRASAVRANSAPSGVSW